MESFATNLLNLLIFLPLLGAIIVVILPKGQDNLARWTAVAVSIPTLIIAIGVFYVFQSNPPDASNPYLFEYSADWFPQIGSSWHVGADGISISMALLTALLTPLALLIAFEHTENPRAILALILGLEMAMMGVFLTLDMVGFFIFWELGLVPMYFMINQWGGSNRRYASNKFFIFTMAGSLGLLLAIQLMAFSVGQIDGAGTAGSPTFDIPTWLQHWPGYQGDGNGEILGFNQSTVKYLSFLAFFVAFSIKIPIWPLHTWLPDAHTEAPTAGSMLLAGVLLKQGAYGFIRFVIPLFPDMVATPFNPRIPFTGAEIPIGLNFALLLAFLAMMGIVMGAFAAWAQDDFKKLVAYSSVNHMGFVVLGLAVLAVVYSGSWALANERYELTVDVMRQSLVDEDIERYDSSLPVRQISELTGDQLNSLALAKIENFRQYANLRAEEFEGLDEEEKARVLEALDSGILDFDPEHPNQFIYTQDAKVALNGTVMQMFNHGLSSAAMFLLVGALYHKAHTRDLRRFGGLWHTIPVFGGLLVFTSMASLGLPGLNGFTGEWLIISGSFRLFPILVLLSMIGLLMTGAYILKGLQKVLHGPPNDEWIEYHENEHSLEINMRETIALAPLVALMLITGIYPNWILPVIDTAVSNVLAFVV